MRPQLRRAVGPLLSFALLPVAIRANDLSSFLSSADLANFLSLPAALTPPLTLDTSINVLFVGFNGEGEAALNVSAAQLGPWFQQLRAVLPHTVAPEPHASPTTLQYATRLHVHCKQCTRSTGDPQYWHGANRLRLGQWRSMQPAGWV